MTQITLRSFLPEEICVICTPRLYSGPFAWAHDGALSLSKGNLRIYWMWVPSSPPHRWQVGQKWVPR